MARGEIQAAERLLDILLAVSQSERPLSAREIAEQVGHPLSSTYRYLRLLRARKILSEAGERGYYQVGTGILALTRGARVHLALPEIARPFMVELSQATRETVLMTERVKDDVVCVQTVESSLPLRYSFGVGKLMPLYAGASSKALLAFLPDDEIERLLANTPLTPFTPDTITDPELLRQDLAQIRERGYALTEGEVDEGVAAVGVPVRDSDGVVRAALSVVGPGHRFALQRIPSLVAALQRTAERIAGML